MTLRQLKWLTVVGPAAFWLLLDAVRHAFAADFFQARPGTLLTAGLVTIAALTIWS